MHRDANARIAAELTKQLVALDPTAPTYRARRRDLLVQIDYLLTVCPTMAGAL